MKGEWVECPVCSPGPNPCLECDGSGAVPRGHLIELEAQSNGE
jgi:hypothetical protein